MSFASPLPFRPLPSRRQQGLLWLVVLALHGVGLASAWQSAPVAAETWVPLPVSVRWLSEAPPSRPAPSPQPQPAAPRKPAPAVSRPSPAPTAVKAAAVAAIAPAAAPATATAVAAASGPVAPASAAPATMTPARFDADYLHNPKPVYPALSRRFGEEGRVLLKVRVSQQGAAEAVEIHSGSGYFRLDAAAREAVSHWRFVPARRGEETVAASVLVPITFALDG